MTSRKRTCGHRDRGGFTLVEIALAMLVLSIGVMGILSVFPAGLEFNKQAINDNRLGMFAENVLRGMRAVAVQESWDDVSNNSGIRLSATAPDLWVLSSPDLVEIEADGQWHENVFRYTFNTSIIDLELRYRLTIDNVSNGTNGVLDDVKYLRLDLVQGRYGPIADVRSYYTELYHTDLSW